MSIATCIYTYIYIYVWQHAPLFESMRRRTLLEVTLERTRRGGGRCSRRACLSKER